jgi:5'-3' exoribonuclease 1
LQFYRWISERYPKINHVITDSALLPEFDHLYLDMNGIIHGCTHPAHLDVSDVITERDMMLGIMHYIDRIITQIVKPKVSVFMAIDGVAPRAKLNQQRSRRFRSAMELAEATKGKTISSDDKAPGGHSSGAFDSNCITPGTDFMGRVSSTIKYFIRKKIKEDPLWRNLKVIFSGQEVPGEGEHKIMQHIREMRNQPSYQPNQRHCMYGQDADLIMLGLVSHEPHFTLLREIVDFTGGFNRNENALKTVKKYTKQSDFQLLHLSVLREYLNIEFGYTLDPASYDIERIIDDFVFMTFLVGNDFLPHMPSLDIGDGAFDLLFSTYKSQRPTWGEGEYLTSPGGHIAEPSRLEAFIAVIGSAETVIFEKREEDEAVYMKKKRKWDKRDGRPEGPSDAQLAAQEAAAQADYLTAIEDMVAKNPNATYVNGWSPPSNPGEKDFKGRYYFSKLKLLPVNVAEHMALQKSYVEGLIWCLAYYYRGCVSWGWFYPYHYGESMSHRTCHVFFDMAPFRSSYLYLQ